MIEPEPEDASTAFVNEELELQQGENMAAHAETQTEAFDHLYRKTHEHQASDRDAETQTLAFGYLYRKTSDHQAPDRNAETQTEGFDYLFPKSSGYQAPDRDFFKSDNRADFTQDFLHTRCPWQSLNMLLLMLLATPNHWTGFKNFLMVLMKLRLNVPFHGCQVVPSYIQK